MFHSPLANIAAHNYLQSVHNVVVERTWLRLRFDFGDSAVIKFLDGVSKGAYDPKDEDQVCVYSSFYSHSILPHFSFHLSQLCRWLWSRLLQRDLEEWAEFRNGVKIRKQTNKPGPSGMSRNDAYLFPERWNGENCLLEIEDMETIRQMKADLGGEKLIMFTTREFSDHAQQVFDTLEPLQLTQENAWDVFRHMLPLVFPGRQFDAPRMS